MNVVQNPKRKDRAWLWSLALSLLIAGLGTAYAFRTPAPKLIEMHGYTTQPDDLQPVADLSTYVVEGVVKRVLPAQWTTPDKRRPLSLEKAVTDPAVQLRTPVRISVQTVYKGANVPKTLLFTLAGGREGDFEVRSAAAMELRPGMKILVFLSEAPPNAGPWSRISRLYPQLYFVVDGDTLHGPLKDVRRAEVQSKLLQGAQP
jgi:hypothetical protein